jgi:hypothetical protein
MAPLTKQRSTVLRDLALKADGTVHLKEQKVEREQVVSVL